MDKKFTYNNFSLKFRRKELRKNQTPEEKFLWQSLNKDQVHGLRFFRQYSVGPYILDFYCPEIRLAVELDGQHHAQEGNKIYDKERGYYLEDKGIQTLRFWNNEVSQTPSKVITKIRDRAKALKEGGTSWSFPT